MILEHPWDLGDLDFHEHLYHPCFHGTSWTLGSMRSLGTRWTCFTFVTVGARRSLSSTGSVIAFYSSWAHGSFGSWLPDDPATPAGPAGPWLPGMPGIPGAQKHLPWPQETYDEVCWRMILKNIKLLPCWTNLFCFKCLLIFYETISNVWVEKIAGSGILGKHLDNHWVCHFLHQIAFRISRLLNLLINKLTLSRGLLLLLSFAEQKVININSSSPNVLASGIFAQDCMIVNSAKTWTDSKLIQSPALDILTLSLLYY